jgi:hypothetical protein
MESNDELMEALKKSIYNGNLGSQHEQKNANGRTEINIGNKKVDINSMTYEANNQHEDQGRNFGNMHKNYQTYGHGHEPRHYDEYNLHWYQNSGPSLKRSENSFRKSSHNNGNNQYRHKNRRYNHFYPGLQSYNPRYFGNWRHRGNNEAGLFRDPLLNHYTNFYSKPTGPRRPDKAKDDIFNEGLTIRLDSHTNRSAIQKRPKKYTTFSESEEDSNVVSHNDYSYEPTTEELNKNEMSKYHQLKDNLNLNTNNDTRIMLVRKIMEYFVLPENFQFIIRNGSEVSKFTSVNITDGANMVRAHQSPYLIEASNNLQLPLVESVLPSTKPTSQGNDYIELSSVATVDRSPSKAIDEQEDKLKSLSPAGPTQPTTVTVATVANQSLTTSSMNNVSVSTATLPTTKAIVAVSSAVSLATAKVSSLSVVNNSIVDSKEATFIITGGR